MDVAGLINSSFLSVPYVPPTIIGSGSRGLINSAHQDTLYVDGKPRVFDVFRIGDRPKVMPSIYAFARLVGVYWDIFYVGMTADQTLADRLSGHHKLDAAIKEGATHLLVRASTLLTVHADEAEMIRHFNPPLNERMPSLLGGG
jgi:hypothetical protein